MSTVKNGYYLCMFITDTVVRGNLDAGEKKSTIRSLAWDLLKVSTDCVCFFMEGVTLFVFMG